MQNIFPEIKRHYFEVFGDLEKEIKFLRKLAFGLLFIVILELIFLFNASKKPPVVIRVDKVAGAEVIKDLKHNNEPTSFEIVSFAKRFTVRYTAYNSYTLSKDLAEAFNQMSSSLQKKAQKELIASGLIQKIKDAGIDTQIEFKEEHLERETEKEALVSLVGVREITRYGYPNREQVLFRADFVLKKVPRSREVPEGLLVEEYRETVLNEVKERK